MTKGSFSADGVSMVVYMIMMSFPLNKLILLGETAFVASLAGYWKQNFAKEFFLLAMSDGIYFLLNHLSSFFTMRSYEQAVVLPFVYLAIVILSC